MRRLALILLGVGVVIASYLATSPALRNRVAVSTGVHILFTAPVPSVTPYDSLDQGKADEYRRLWARGYEWAWGQRLP